MSQTAAWAILLLAGLCEVAWSFSMKRSDGFTRSGWAAAAVGLSLVSFVLLGWAMKTLPLSTSYAVWTGIGAVGAAVLGIVALGESASAARIVCIVLIVAGIVGLKLVR